METLIAKYQLHPIIDHFTIALLSTGVLADVVGYGIAALLSQRGPRLRGVGDRLRGAALVLIVPGALAAIFSRLTGESEGREWDHDHCEHNPGLALCGPAANQTQSLVGHVHADWRPPTVIRSDGQLGRKWTIALAVHKHCAE